MLSRLRIFPLLAAALTGALLFTSCGKNGKPSYLIPEDTLVMILKDIHIAQAGVDLTIGKQEEKDRKKREYNRVVLDRYTIDKQRFLQTFDYYESNPVLLDSVYSRVIEQINMELAPLQKRVTPKTKVPIAE